MRVLVGEGSAPGAGWHTRSPPEEQDTAHCMLRPIVEFNAVTFT